MVFEKTLEILWVKASSHMDLIIDQHRERKLKARDGSRTGNRHGPSAYLTPLRHQGHLQTPADV